MWLLGRENLRSLTPVLSSKYYIGWVKKLRKFLKYSRQKKYYNNPYNLLPLQIAIAELISRMDNVIKEGKNQLKIAKDQKNIKRIEDIEIGITSNRQIARILRTIADGLAWRVLDFDRPFIRTMAEPQRYSGSVALDSIDYKKLEKKAMSIASTRKSKILLNDITNFLRVGDLIEVGEKTIIWESKRSSRNLKSVYTIFRGDKSQALSKQMKKLVDAQVVRDFRKIRIGNDEIDIMDLPFSFENYLSEVKEIIKEARQNMFSVKQLNDCLIVSCKDQKQIIDYSIKTRERIWEKFSDKNSWNKKHRITAYSNFDSFYDSGGDFMRSETPYSVYPFLDNDVMDLISGNLLLKSQLDITKVKKMIEKAGWKVEDVDIDTSLTNMEKIIPLIKAGKGSEVFIDDTIFILSRGAFVLKIPMYWVTRIATEFMNPKVLIKHIESIYQGSQYGISKKVQPFILGERKVWK